MSPDSRHRVDTWWSDLLGVPTAMLWRDTVTIGLHAGLGDYPGVFVVERHGRVHLSMPDWVTAAQVGDLEARAPSELASRTFWQEWSPTSATVVLGPAVHAFTDREPDLADDAQELLVLTVGDLAPLRDAVSEEEWDESGFGDAEGLVHAVMRDGHVVAAAHLSGFLGGRGDVSVLVHPRSRGRGLGAFVGAAATRTAVRTQGMARWRARSDNAPSRALSKRLGFEDYCRQLAVRPADD